MDTWENKNDPGDPGNLTCYKNVEINIRVIAISRVDYNTSNSFNNNIYLRFRIIFVISI